MRQLCCPPSQKYGVFSEPLANPQVRGGGKHPAYGCLRLTLGGLVERWPRVGFWIFE